jgi:DHA1 family bicyclomycin/chloramphenicol resistance-like MFS transporter
LSPLARFHSVFNIRDFFTSLNKDLKLIFFANLAGSFGDGLYAYIMPYYMKDSLKADAVEIGILYAMANLFAAMTLVIAGLLADRYDRKKILVLGWAAWVPAPLIFAVAKNWVQMIPGMALWGVTIGPPTMAAFIIATTNKNKLTLTFTVISSAWSLGYIFSPALGGYVGRIVGMPLVFLTASICYTAATVILLLMRSQFRANHISGAERKETSTLQLLKSRKLLTLSIFLGAIMFAVFLFRPFIPTFLTDVYGYNGFQIGVLGSFSFFGSALLGVMLGRLGDKTQKTHALAAALALIGFALMPFLLFNNFQVLLVTQLLVGASYIAWPLISAIIGPLAPERARALWVAIPLAVGMFSSILAPYLGGVLYEISPFYPFVFGIAVTLFLALVALAKTLD